jgi:Ca2+-binding EF-hand superfamily protein
MKAKALLISLSVFSVAVIAHEGMHGPGSQFDADQSGALSVKEFTAYLKDSKQDISKAAERFAAMDANKDGQLSSAELLRGLNAKPK